MKHIHVQPGELHWSATPREFRTVLGSCVSVCLWDRLLHIGGLNHFVLPEALGGENDARFGNFAIPQLISALERRGCTALVAKLFGGACVIHDGKGATIGAANVALARQVLTASGISIIAERTGGLNGVTLRYSSATGEALLREIRSRPA